MHGIKAKLMHAKRYSEKVQMRKTLKAHDERNVKQPDSGSAPEGALPTYLLDREGQKDAKALSTALKQKRKDKAAKYSVPLPKVRGIAEDEMFKVVRTGKAKTKAWKRMVTKATFVGEGFTRKPVKMERFIRPMALRYKKANVTHRTLLCTPKVDATNLRSFACSRSQGNFPAANHGCQEKPSVAYVHTTGCPHKGNSNRGQRFGAWHGYDRWKGRSGKVCPGDEQPSEYGLFKTWHFLIAIYRKTMVASTLFCVSCYHTAMYRLLTLPSGLTYFNVFWQ
jgi:ribosomal protein S8E